MDNVVLDGDVVTLVHPDAAVGAVVNVVVVDVDVVTFRYIQILDLVKL